MKLLTIAKAPPVAVYSLTAFTGPLAIWLYRTRGYLAHPSLDRVVLPVTLAITITSALIAWGVAYEKKLWAGFGLLISGYLSSIYVYGLTFSRRIEFAAHFWLSLHSVCVICFIAMFLIWRRQKV